MQNRVRRSRAQWSRLYMRVSGKACKAPRLFGSVSRRTPRSQEEFVLLGRSTDAGTAHALEQDGVALKDIQTTGLSLQQTFSPDPAGYQVDDQVSVTLHHLATAGAAIDHAMAAAGDAGRLEGVTFSVSNTSPLLAAARQQAVGAARSDAAQLAGAAGDQLVGLRSLTEETDQDSQAPYPQPVMATGGASPSAAPVPVQPGTQQMSVVVIAVWGVSPEPMNNSVTRPSATH